MDFLLRGGIKGAILFSRNGKDWNIQTSGQRIQLNDISFGNGRFVTVGSRGIFLSSIDADTFEEPEPPRKYNHPDVNYVKRRSSIVMIGLR